MPSKPASLASCRHWVSVIFCGYGNAQRLIDFFMSNRLRGAAAVWLVDSARGPATELKNAAPARNVEPIAARRETGPNGPLSVGFMQVPHEGRYLRTTLIVIACTSARSTCPASTFVTGATDSNRASRPPSRILSTPTPGVEPVLTWGSAV